MTEPSDQFGTSDSSMEEGVAPKNVQHALTNNRKFAPWHKPRKQWLRREQWGSAIKSLISTFKRQPSVPLRYLSLPGPDLLDVRTIRPICEECQVPLHFTGLNSDEGDIAARSLNALIISEVRALPNIHPSSEVIVDKFEHLANIKSTAHTRVFELRQSYDVINIDLCGSIANSEIGVAGPNIVNSIFTLLEHQSRHRTEDWLFFITARSNKTSLNSEVIDKFLGFINSSIIDVDPQATQDLISKGLFSPNDFAGGKLVSDNFSEKSFSNCFSIGFSCWVVTRMINHNPAWRAKMMPLYGYHIALDDPACDMLSIGFWCQRLPSATPPDDFGIAVSALTATPENRDETKQKSFLKARDEVAKRIDLDVYLYNNPQEYAQALDETAAMLEACQYNKANYLTEQKKLQAEMHDYLVATGLVAEPTVPTDV